jgi:pimeloyl-ACP methyl ester carboxylesterase
MSTDRQPPLHHRRTGGTSLAIAAAIFALPNGALAAAPEPVGWETCGEGFECAALSVPWDAEEPTGESLSIPLVRHAATGPGERIGVLLYNPGGPGVPGTETLMALLGAFPAPLQERFDIVSFDPRGTGGAEHLDCGTDLAALFMVDPAATDGSAADVWSDFAAACETAIGDHLGQLSTVATAEDIDRIREALGEERVSWFGTSYGTRLGAEYLRQHPDRVRAMVLDGAMDPAAPLSQQVLDMATAAEATLARHLAACWGIEPCPLADDPAEAYDALAAQLREAPLTGSDGRSLGIVALQAAAQSAAAIPFFFGQGFVDALVAAQAGDADGLLALGPDSAQGTFDAQMAILCNDESERLAPAEAADLARRLDEEAPRVGLAVAMTWGVGCQAFPPAGRPVAAFESEAAAPVLVVGSTGDPSTSYAWSERMAEVLGAPLLTREGDGHTAFFNTFLAGCTGTAVSAFLLDPEAASPPATCLD